MSRNPATALVNKNKKLPNQKQKTLYTIAAKLLFATNKAIFWLQT
jgi:hypothetical protein